MSTDVREKSLANQLNSLKGCLRDVQTLRKVAMEFDDDLSDSGLSAKAVNARLDASLRSIKHLPLPKRAPNLSARIN